VLAFRRGDGFVCTVNTGSSPVPLPVPGALLLASTDVSVAADRVVLPADSAAWWRI